MSAMMKSNEVLISVHAFASDGEELMKKVLSGLSLHLTVGSISSVYKAHRTAHHPQHIHDLRRQTTYAGLSISLRGITDLSPSELLAYLQHLERQLRSQVLHQNLSLNLLAYNDESILTPDITLPHPGFHNRPEELVPSAEIWPDYVHPVLNTSLRDLASSYDLAAWGEFFSQGKSLLDFCKPEA